MAWDNFCLPDLKVASLVQMSHQAESEFHRLCEMTIKPSQSLLFAIDPHLAFHVMENTGLRSRKGLIGSAGIVFQNADKSQLAMVESSASDRFAFAQCSL
jgi:hypothetical protein